jgi:hypothetical protein
MGVEKRVKLSREASVIKQFVEERLSFAHKANFARPRSIIRFSDTAYVAMAVVTKGYPEYAWYVARAIVRVINESRALDKTDLPYIVTAGHVMDTGLTYPKLEAILNPESAPGFAQNAVKYA